MYACIYIYICISTTVLACRSTQVYLESRECLTDYDCI